MSIEIALSENARQTAGRNPPLATDHHLENTDGVLRGGEHPMSVSRGGTLLLLCHADVIIPPPFLHISDSSLWWRVALCFC